MFKAKAISTLPIALLLLLLSTSCKDEQSPTIDPPIINSDVIQGYFFDSNGEPINGALVEATNSNGIQFSNSVTKSDGSFELDNFPTNTANSIISFIKNNEIIQQIKLETFIQIAEKNSSISQTKKAEIVLGGDYDLKSNFSVSVVDANHPYPISGATVQLSISNNAV